MRIVRKERPKEDDGDVFYVARTEKELVPHPKKSATRRLTPFVIFGIVICLATITMLKVMGDSPQDTRSVVLALQGKKVLDEKALRKLVTGQNITAYWIGARDKYKYTLTALPDGNAYVRYLPNGKGLGDTSATYMVIATYPLKNAFSITKANGKATDGVGFINLDGHAVYYKTTQPASVYVGLRGANYQIEIFDPVAGQALVSASTAGLLQKIS
jgi:hypothetical protein